MPAPTEKEYVASEKLPQQTVDDESVAECFDYGVSVADKTDSYEGPEDCNALTALSQSTPCDLATSTQPDGGDGPAKEGNCKVVVEKEIKVLSDVDEDRQLSEETNKGVNTCEDQQKSQDGEKREKEETVENDPDVDGGWSYMVLLGTFIIMVMLIYT